MNGQLRRAGALALAFAPGMGQSWGQAGFRVRGRSRGGGRVPVLPGRRRVFIYPTQQM